LIFKVNACRACVCHPMIHPMRSAATIEHAINELATITGIGRSRVWTVARALREAGTDLDLWPVGARGRAKPRYPNARHLGNLIVALAATQSDETEIAADRAQAFQMMVQIDGARPGLSFGDGLGELIDLAARDIKFRGAVWVHQGPVVQLAPTHNALAEISGGPTGGRYRAADMDVIKVASGMHVRSMGITSIALIDGSVIKTAAELLANFRAAMAASETESEFVSPDAAPASRQ
jgi:hypothetical protein